MKTAHAIRADVYDIYCEKCGTPGAPLKLTPVPLTANPAVLLRDAHNLAFHDGTERA